MVLKRIFGAILTLVVDNHINYVKEIGGKTFFAYFEEFDEKSTSFKDLFEKALTDNKPVDLMLERDISKHPKDFDYVVQVYRKSYETPEQRMDLMGDND